MKKFWNSERFSFHKLPEIGRFKFEHFLLASVFIVSMFIGFGQLPLLVVIIQERIVILGDSAEIMNVLSARVGENRLLVLLLIPFILTFVAALFSFKWIHRTPILPFFTSRSSFDWKRVILSFSAWAGIMGLMLLISFYTGSKLVWNFNAETFLSLVLISFLLIPLQITCEELIFRSYMFKGLSFLRKPMLQLLICGVLFGLMHLGNPEIEKLGKIAIIFYIWTGVFLGLIAHFDNGIELTIGYHAANNIFAAIIITSNWQAFQTDALWIDMTPPKIGWDMLVTLLLAQPLLLVLFNWKYKWGILSKKRNLEDM
jgi:uncharacterized protein